MTEIPGALARGPVTPLRALLLVLALTVGLGVAPPPVRAAQQLAPREVQRLLRVAHDDLESARALLAQDDQRAAKARLDEAEAAYRKILDAAPRQKDAAVGLSSVLFLTQRYEDGIRLMEPFYQADAEDHEVAHQLGLHMYRAGHQNSAVPLLEQVAGDPGRFDASWLLAVHFYHQASWARGLPFAERYVAARPDDLRAYGVLGTYYLKTERFAEAVNALDGYLEAFPDNLAARINRANALFRMGRLDRAAVEYEALVAKHPERMRLIYNLAAVRIRQERCEDALPLLDRFIAQEDRDGSAKYFKADCLLKLGRLDEARDAFEGAREGAENNPWIYHGLSRIAAQAERFDEAIAQSRRAAEIAPTEVEIVAWLGTVLRKSGQPTEALAWHDRALALDAELPALYVERGRDLWLLKRLDEALETFTRAHALAPELTAATEGIAAVRTARGVEARAAGDLARATEELSAAVAVAPDYAAARLGLALVLVDRGRASDAAALLEPTPPATGPDHAAVNALVRLHLGDYDGATEAVAQASGGSASLTPLVNEVKGYVAAHAGRWEDAATALEAANEAAPRDELDRARIRAWFEHGLDRLGRGDTAAARAALAKVGRRPGVLSRDDRATYDFANAALLVVAAEQPERATGALQKLLRSAAYRGGRFAALRDTGELYVAYGHLRAGAPRKALTALARVRGDLAPAARAMTRQAQDALARRAFTAGDHAGAARIWAELAAEDPDDQVSRCNQAAALFAAGRTDEAERIWVAVDGAGGPPEARYDLAVAADRRGDYRAAWEHLRRYLAANPAEAELARERLEAKERVFGFGAGGGS